MSILILALAIAASSSAGAGRPLAPIGSPAEWIGTDDYPKSALRDGIEGRTGFILDVGEDGSVTDRNVTRTSGNDGLDAATCALLTNRAHFQPARDPKGRPHAATYSNTVIWQIPKGQPFPLENSNVSFAFDVDESGHATNCAVAGIGKVGEPAALYRLIEANSLFVPGIGRDGKPARKHVVTRLSVEVTEPAASAPN